MSASRDVFSGEDQSCEIPALNKSQISKPRLGFAKFPCRLPKISPSEFWVQLWSSLRARFCPGGVPSGRSLPGSLDIRQVNEGHQTSSRREIVPDLLRAFWEGRGRVENDWRKVLWGTMCALL